MSNYFRQVYDWVLQSSSWNGIGPFWQMLGVLLGFFTLLQIAPDKLAGGILFSRKAVAITLLLDALWVFMVFVAPFIPPSAIVGVVFTVLLIVLAIIAFIVLWFK